MMKGRLINARRAGRTAVRWAGIVGVACSLASTAAQAQSTAPRASGETAAAELPESLAPELRAELDSYISNALLAFNVPGAAVAVLQGGRVAYRGAFGVRGDGHPRAVDTRSLFMVGSITKSMTSSMIATLVDEGLLGWDASVKALLPTFQLAQREYESQVTVRHLLSHQSGLSRSDIALFFGQERPLGLLGEVAEIPSYAAPGTSFEYQNQAYALAGFAAARAAGARYTNESLARTYERLMVERLFEPVRMRRTTLDLERALRSGDHAWPNEYSALSGEMEAVQVGFERFATTVAPAGGVWSNVDDMARYALLHLGQGLNLEGQRVMSAASLQETHTPMVSSGAGSSYGLGWGIFDGSLGRMVTHSGGTAGFASDLLLLPEQGLGLVVLTNRASSFAFIQAVERYVAEVLLGLPRSPDDDLLAAEQALRDELAALLAVTAEVAAADVEEFLGAYEEGVRFVRRGADLLLRNEFGELTLRAVVGYPGAFLVVGNVLGGAVAQFSSDSDGKRAVTVGLPAIEGEEVRLLQPITLHKLERRARAQRPQRWTADPRGEWHRAVRYLRDCGVKTPRGRVRH